MARRKADARTIQKRARFKHLRLLKEKTQLAVAQDFGVTESFIRNLETGRCNPEAGFMFKLAKYFETTVDDLFQDLAE
jgi:putative transcriptional regulator